MGTLKVTAAEAGREQTGAAYVVLARRTEPGIGPGPVIPHRMSQAGHMAAPAGHLVGEAGVP